MEKQKENRKGWYVLRAISGKESKVKELLDGAIKNGGLGQHLFQVLIPTEKVVSIRGGKKVIKEKNLFSGYVFIEADLTGELIHELVNTTNVIDFLRGRDKASAPTKLSEADVKRMMGTADEMSEQPDQESIEYYVGENVRVTEGPFNTFDGIIEEVLKEKNKLKVAVKIFGRKTLVELDNWQVARD